MRLPRAKLAFGIGWLVFADGAIVIMTYRVDALSELMPWLLEWGASAEVLDRAELRMALRNEAAGLVEILT